jgi:hypothetical protein
MSHHRSSSVGRGFRTTLGESAWTELGLSVALVCRDAIPPTEDESNRKEWLASALRWIGALATELGHDDDLALSVLADFADERRCEDIVASAMTLVAELPETALRDMTEKAATIVDRTCPEQSFRFRATLILVSMMASGSENEAVPRWLANKSDKQ